MRVSTLSLEVIKPSLVASHGGMFRGLPVLRGKVEGVLVSSGCHSKLLKVGWLKQQKFSQLWRLEVPDLGQVRHGQVLVRTQRESSGLSSSDKTTDPIG